MHKTEHQDLKLKHLISLADLKFELIKTVSSKV